MTDSGSVALKILHEESHFLVVDKPVGLFTQAAAGIESVQTRLASQLKQRDQHPGTPFIGLPHRLDRGTSGVMLIARNQRALSRFGDQFQSRKIGKYYLAAAAGKGLSEPQSWRDYVRKVPDQPVAEVCIEGTDGAKLAELTVRPLAQAGGVYLLLIHLLTGRMHQIRIQAASRGLHILGDTTYGGPEFFDLDSQSGPEGERASMTLHALRLEIRHPQTAKPMAFTALPPAFWQNLPKEICTAFEDCCQRSQSESESVWID
jgi:23S rRNA pseudouridine1911/1915/1917 synthase